MRRRNDGAAVAMTAMLVSGMLMLSACQSTDTVKTDVTGATEETAQTGQETACVVTYYDSDGRTVQHRKIRRHHAADRAADGGGRKRGMRERVYARKGRKHFCRLVCDAADEPQI